MTTEPSANIPRHLLKRLGYHIPWYRRVQTTLVLAGSVTLLTIIGATVAMGLRVEYAPRRDSVGNFPDNIARLRATVDARNFSFVVMGDIQNGVATFKELLDVARSDQPDFAILVGDLVCDPEMARHRLFLSDLAWADLPFAVLAAPGNHDIYPDAEVGVAEFEELWGAAQFHFTLGDCLFIILNNAPHYHASGEYLQYLHDVVSARSPAVQHILVFMHMPPQGLNDAILCRYLEGGQEFLRLCEELNVTYVFMGDHHGYVKTVRGPTTYIVTGGAGANLRGAHGRFHHLTRIQRRDGHFEESVLVVQPQSETFELAKRNLAVYLWPLVTRNAVSVVVTVALAVLGLVGLIFSISDLRRYRRADREFKTLSTPRG